MPAEHHKEHRRKLRGNKGIEHRADAVPEGSKSTKFFPTPSHLLPQVMTSTTFLFGHVRKPVLEP